MAAEQNANSNAQSQQTAPKTDVDLSDARAQWRERMKVFKNAARESERLTADDYAIRINAKG